MRNKRKEKDPLDVASYDKPWWPRAYSLPGTPRGICNLVGYRKIIVEKIRAISKRLLQLLMSVPSMLSGLLLGSGGRPLPIWMRRLTV